MLGCAGVVPCAAGLFCETVLNTIFNQCWGEDYFPNSRSLDQHVSQLRKRIEADPKVPKIIRTVHGVGYRYEE